MSIAGSLFIFGQNFSNRFALSMQTKLMVIPKSGAAIAGVILNIVFVKFYGLQGLVFAAILTQTLFVVLLIVIWQLSGKQGVQTQIQQPVK